MDRMTQVLAGLLLGAAVASAATRERPQYRIGELAPKFELTDVEGKKVSSESLQGAPAVLFFAATWCPYSNRLSKAVEKLHQRYKDKGVRVLLIDIKEPKEKVVQKWVKEKKMTCLVLVDGEGTVTRSYGPPPDFWPTVAREDTMPASVLLLDAEGRIQYFPQPTENPGEIDFKLKALQKKLDRLLEAKQ